MPVRTPRFVRPLASRTLWGTIAGLGFMLSPLSWWNDALVNLPLAALMASLANRILGVEYATALVACYWATNLLGMLLLLLGARGALGGRLGARELGLSLAFSLAYTLAAWRVLEALGLG